MSWRFWLGALLGLEVSKGRLVTTPMDAQRRIALVSGLMALDRAEELEAGFSVVLDKIRICQEDRNIVAHGLWALSRHNVMPVAMSLKTKTLPFEIVAESFPVERLRAVSFEIDFCRREVVDLTYAIAPDLFGDPRGDDHAANISG